MTRYINTFMHGQRETLDSLDSSEFKSYKEFRAELSRLRREYVMSGHGAPYISQKACKGF